VVSVIFISIWVIRFPDNTNGRTAAVKSQPCLATLLP
jgi:hypothetical protein